MNKPTAIWVVALMLFGACTQDSEQTPEPEQLSHIHGLGLSDAGEVFVATHFGLYVGRDGTWARRSHDRDDHMGFSLTPAGMWRSGHPTGGGSLGVQQSTDGGRTWKTLSAVLNPPVDFHAMTATSSASATLYGWDSGSRGLFRSTDAGKTWQKPAAQDLPRGVGALAVSGTDNLVYATTERGLFRSTDGGESWQPVNPELLFALAVGGQPEVLFASKAQGGGVLRSTDGGTTWTPTGAELGDVPVVALAASTDGNGVLAADQQAGIWNSDDGGASWSTLQTP